MNRLEKQAKSFIKNSNPVVYDVAAHYGQLVDNVAHTQWFLAAVMEWIK